MDIDDIFYSNARLKNWENACSDNGWFGGNLYTIWQSVEKEKISEEEKKDLMLAIIDRLLTEKRIVFEIPGRDWGGPWETWHTDKETIMKRLRERYPDINDPDYENKIIDYFMSDNAIGWIGRGTEWFEEGKPGRLYLDGTYMEPKEWE